MFWPTLPRSSSSRTVLPTQSSQNYALLATDTEAFPATLQMTVKSPRDSECSMAS